MSSRVSAWAVVVAAGEGRRFGPHRPKQFSLVAGHPLALWALAPFMTHTGFAGASLVVPEDTLGDPPEWLRSLQRGELRVVSGGATRTDSVRLGLESVPASIGWVAVHDGARPLLDHGMIDRVMSEAAADRGAIAARPVTDSLKRADAERRVVVSVARTDLWRAETPQIFPRRRLLDFHRRAAEEGIVESDCSGLAERYGFPVTLVPVAAPNPKVTTVEDLELVEAWIARRGLELKLPGG